MCRISSNLSHISITAKAFELFPSGSNKQSEPSPCADKIRELDDVTTSPVAEVSLPLSANDGTIESETTGSTDDSQNYTASLPASTRVYQSVVIEPFHQPTISLIFRHTPYSSAGTTLPLVPCSHTSILQEEEGNDAAPIKSRRRSRYVYETPPPSPCWKERMLLLEPPPTPILKRTIVDFPRIEDSATPIDLFLPLILT
jgi:hypothetical protein